VPLDGPVYQQRSRAQSFGSVAEDYDRFRPSYPVELIDDLAALNPRDVLDIGCGTGKATRLLAARGLSVLGVEVDAKMAAVAQGHGLDVDVASFEDWDDRGRRFDLITSGQAWHWVDPAIGAPKAADLLRPGGALALFWNHFKDRDEATRAAFDEVYRQYAPALLGAAERGRKPHPDRPYVDDLKPSGRFASVEVKEYEYEVTYTSEAWIGMVQTHSDHLSLAPDQRAALAGGLRALIDGMGGSIATPAGTYSIWARP
jgi:trans-aconitate methyltransferase